MSTFKLQSFLPIYVGIIALVLIAAILLVDKQTPKTALVILLLMYIVLLVFYWRQTKVQTPTIKIPSLSDYRTNSKRSSNLSNFQASAQRILMEVGLQKKSEGNQMNYYSPFSRNLQHPVSLSQLPTPENEYFEQSNIFGTFNIQIWRQQFRLALEQFKDNLKSEPTSTDSYTNLLAKLKLKTEGIPEAEDIVKSFLLDRATQYCTHNIKAVGEVNKILARNFGLNLTKVESTNSKQIAMDEFRRLLDYYFTNRTLPSAYKNMMATATSFGLLEKQTTRLHADMMELKKYEQILQPISYFPLERFNPCLLVYILRAEFPNAKIQINSDSSRSSSYRSSNMLSSLLAQKKEANVYCLLVQIDNMMSLMSMPQFRTKNCMKICLIFSLWLIKNEHNLSHPLLKSLCRLQK